MNRPDSLGKKQWHLAPPLPVSLKQNLAHRNQVLVQVLYNRGINTVTEIETFLAGHYLAKDDPFLLKDMDKAMARLEQAINRDETIAVYGDFDADGVTATVLMVQALRGLGLERRKVQPYIPDRVDEGYGLNKEALEMLRSRGIDLVISVDCGIRSVAEVKEAQDIGLDMIVTDHHSLGRDIPPAVAVINPKRTDSDYPERRLAGVGTAFKFAQALQQSFPDRARFEDGDLLDLVALGTVADLVPLLGENRRLVIDGLQHLNECRRPGIKALIDVSGLKPGAITTESIAFGLAPRINAAGRLSHAYDAARLLNANNSIQAKEYAEILNQLNRDRQKLTGDMSELAEGMVDSSSPVLFAADERFVSGVVGLVASRLAEIFYRPAIVIEIGSKDSRGSCRSIPEFHITKALDQIGDLLIRHGGHSQAAGFTIDTHNLDEFKFRMVEIAASELDLEALVPTLNIDAELDLADIDWALFGVLETLEPTGMEIESPIFMSRNVHVYGHRAVGRDGSHLQLWVHDGSGRMKLPCIAFRQGAWAGTLPDQIDIAYSVAKNEWNGRRDLQLVVQDIRNVTTIGRDE